MMGITFLLTLMAIGGYAQDLTNIHGLKRALTESCELAGAQDKTNEVIQSAIVFLDCMSPLFNQEELGVEFMAAKQKGSYQELFKKMCKKSTLAVTCLNPGVKSVLPCMQAYARTFFNMTKNEAIVEFMCYNDGERSAKFFEAHGLECLQSRFTHIGACIETVNKEMKKEVVHVLNKKCRMFHDLSTCIVKALKGCESPVPADTVQSLFQHLGATSECHSLMEH